MLFKRKKKTVTTQEAIAAATTKLAEDVSNLSVRRDSAVSTFRNTANQLDSINEELRGTMDNFTRVAAFIAEQSNAAAKMISDNTKVRDKIVELIGEE